VNLRIILILLAVTVASTPSNAQPLSGPTDHELHAAFCAGALKAEIDRVARDDASPKSNEMHEHLQAWIRESEEKRRRFAAYLVATGVLADLRRREASAGLTLAMRQGEAEKAFDLYTLNRAAADRQTVSV
jgi:hypothetical protein